MNDQVPTALDVDSVFFVLFCLFVCLLLVPAESAVAMEDLEIGPTFPALGSMIVTFPNFEQAGRLVSYMEQHPNKPKIALLPTIFVRIRTVVARHTHACSSAPAS